MEKTNFNRKAKDSIKIKGMVDMWVKKKGFLAQGVTIEELGRKLGINRTYISNYINDTYNTNFNGWLNSLRISESQKIMKASPEMSVGQIACLVGYADITHFSKQFKLITGTCPNKWKKNCAK